MAFSAGATGLSAGDKRPRIGLQVLFGASPNSTAGLAKRVITLANKTAAGSATPDTATYACFVADDAQTYFGIGSEHHIGAQDVFAIAPSVSYFGLAVTVSAGVAATGTITVGGTTSAANITETFYIHGVAVAVSITSGQSAATVATNIGAAINALGPKLCVTASVSTNVVTLTFRHPGTRGNLCKLRKVDDAAVTSSTLTFTLSGTLLTGGTLTDSLTTAVGTLANAKWDRIALAQVDQTNAALLQTGLLSAAGPTTNKRQQAIMASVDTLGNATTIAQALNEQRMQLVWAANCEKLPVSIAACVAAVRAVQESAKSSVNLTDTFNPTATDLYPSIPAPPDPSLYTSDAQMTAALAVGLTPLGVGGDGHVRIVRSITTHSVDSLSNPDYRTLDTVNVTVPDDLADDMQARLPGLLQQMNLIDDVVAGDDPLPDGVITPNGIKALCGTITRDAVRRGDIQNFLADYASWVFSLAGSASPGRVNATMPITPATWLTGFSGQIRQKSAGF